MLTLPVVHDLALVVLVHLRVVDSSIPNVAIDSSVGAALISDRLQESRATRAGAPKD